MKLRIAIPALIVLVVSLACNLATTATPAPGGSVNVVETAVVGTAQAALIATQQSLPTPTAFKPVANTEMPLQTIATATLLPNPPAVDCQVRTFIKDASGMHEQEDPYIVMGEWTNGFATFETAKVCAAVVAKGGNSFDIIWDQDADNVSFILNSPMFSWEEVQQLGKDLGISRIGIVHNHPTGRSCIEYDVANPNPQYGPVLYFHLYDRADWSANPAYYCPAMVIHTATP